MKSCEEAAARDDNIFELLKHRHHSKHGEISIEFLLSRHLILPNKTDSQYFDALIYFSQLSQAMVVKTQAEIYRYVLCCVVNTVFFIIRILKIRLYFLSEHEESKMVEPWVHCFGN